MSVIPEAFPGSLPYKRSCTIALAGNPNVGKSTVFNALTGLHQHTGNWAGKTVENAEGQLRIGDCTITLADLPGVYSLTPRSAEERAAREYLLSGRADAVIVVCDATALSRGIHLVLQILELTNRCVVCCNLMDEAEYRGIHVDCPALSAALGVPVIPADARRGRGLSALIEAALTAAFANSAPSITPFWESTPTGRVKCARELCRNCVRQEDRGEAWRRRLDRLLTGRLTAFPLMALGLALIFWITIRAANVPSSYLNALFNRIEPHLLTFLQAIRIPSPVTQALVYGVWRVTAWVVSVMLPPMAVFFPLFTLAEDAGLLPRIAFNLDRAFSCCRACGKQALTTCMGFGCNAVGVTGCRIIDSPRERLIALLTNSFVPCNGRFPTLIALISLFFAGTGLFSSVQSAVILFALILLSLFMTLAISRLLSATLLRGLPSSFTLELPPYRRPQVLRVLLRSLLDRTVFVLGRAISAAAPAGLTLWLLGNIPAGDTTLLTRIAGFLDPVGHFLGMDGVIMLAFILSLPANEIMLPIALMGYLSQSTISELGSLDVLGQLLRANGWTSLTALCTMFFSLFHWPCATTLLTIRRETGSWRYTALAALLPTAVGVILCTLTASVGRMLGLG
ncbi:MAG: ferrous iron transporter B [Clostridia bacterium]|nr:ferrous iron transporter B [Clostridia bacterium]